MYFIDSHCHLYLKEFQNDWKKSVEDALKNKVEKIILPNLDSTSILAMNEIADAFPNNCFPAIGIHPSSVKKNYSEELKIIEEELKKTKYFAVGEIGLDFYWDKTYIKEQKIALEFQLELARKYGLPVIIHSRNSMDEIIEIMKNYEGLTGVFHCFSGNLKHAEEVTSMGFKIGITGVVTYKNSGLAEIVKKINIENLLLETDAPFLSPIPHRGKRNESAYIPLIAEKIAEVKNITIEEVEETTTRTAEEVFKI
ncbi:MAG: TatD family hydrolase [Bacteroidales bacterium]|nr:TatD family hydrolase [Bacteroidales bacterium]